MGEMVLALGSGFSSIQWEYDAIFSIDIFPYPLFPTMMAGSSTKCQCNELPTKFGCILISLMYYSLHYGLGCLAFCIFELN